MLAFISAYCPHYYFPLLVKKDSSIILNTKVMSNLRYCEQQETFKVIPNFSVSIFDEELITAPKLFS